jgi:hypothetical protein
LLERFEEQLDLPMLFVDFRNGSRTSFIPKCCNLPSQLLRPVSISRKLFA